MGTILESLPIFMFIGIVIIIGISQFNRVVGASLGVVFWIAVAIVGTTAYDQGGAIGLPGVQFPQWAFVSLCVFFVAIHIYGAYAANRRRKYGSHKQRLLDEYEDDET